MSENFTVTNNSQEVEVSLADLAGLDMSAVEAVAGGFELTPKGAYVFKVLDAKLAEFADYPVITFELEIIECLALASDDKTPEGMVGVKHDETIFIIDVQKSVGQAKFLMTEAGYRATGTLQELLDGFCGTKFSAKVKHKAKKNDPETIYANIEMKSVKAVAE